ncbi:hypothetical protein M9H77_11270 [Catharanthus roseus]|uniref:Uncharacterized protein n=1 Tax=Catharanthus roseus TaxID=4058 RepID=A0ACC0BE35_CATRO|nr:hypothetical protein M9H77_11270 [Catharanthus roseus]
MGRAGKQPNLLESSQVLKEETEMFYINLTRLITKATILNSARGSEVYIIRMHYSRHLFGNEFKSYVGGKVSHFNHCEADKMSLIELNNMTKEGGQILDLDVSNGDDGENFDFEDENEGPLEKVDDMITIDAVDESTLYNLLSLESIVDGTQTEILENQIDVSKMCNLINEAGPSATESKSLANPDGIVSDSKDEGDNSEKLAERKQSKYPEFNPKTDMPTLNSDRVCNLTMLPLKKAIIENSIKEGRDAWFMKNDLSEFGQDVGSLVSLNLMLTGEKMILT